MTISSESINQAVSAVSEAGSIADAANTLSSSGADPGIVATVGAVAAIAGAGTNPVTGAGTFLGTIGIVAETYNLIVEGSDGEFSWDDIGAAAGLVGANLMRTPGGQAAGAYFLLFSLTYKHLNNLGHWIGQNAPLPHEINDWFRQALTTASPLILDLDGDGVETLRQGSGILFDHANDGIREGTGWVGRDDGLLVLDRNGNGEIDSGRELFGTNTERADGSLAANGFQALEDFDNDGDGVIDANDAIWSELKIWQDANTNGRVDEGELLDLDTVGGVGLREIQLAHETGNAVDANGNFAIATGRFVWNDGREGDAVDIDFVTNAFYREFSDTVAVPESLRGLPDMRGSGAVRDLREAMMRPSGLVA